MDDVLDDQILVNADYAAELLSISPRLLQQLTADGEIPCIRLGTRVLYYLPSLHKWAARRSKSSPL